MAAVVLVQAIVIGVLALLACGLLRSHTEILRALQDLGAGGRRRAAPAPRTSPVRFRVPERTGRAAAALDLAGTSPNEAPLEIGVLGAGQHTVLAFLSTTCHTCSGFWRSFRDSSSTALPGDTRLVIVTKGPAEESAPKVRDLAGDALVVMSTAAWTDYAVPVTPYFVQIDGPSGRVVGQGSGATWDQVMSLLNQATADGGAARRSESEADVDSKLLAAGIRPGDRSLYPSRARESGTE